ncbi:MAG: YggS family pyridoxal phosphate-dependent enzyme [Muribaculaceae bacterium]|nr:YggS family pyridoxal phosphate-dependent enzyme [Muribaculaceae bacterium]
MDSIESRLKAVVASLPPQVTLVAVSKFHPVEAIREAYDAGQRIFGESRAQELVAKAPQLPTDIRWHFIGHLQTNKVAIVVPFVELIHSVDSLRLLRVIDREAARIGKCQDILLQLHVAEEETKFGFAVDEIDEAVAEASRLENIRLRGLMAMATNTDDTERVRADFLAAKAAFDSTRQSLVADSRCRFDTLSMGMSDDRDIAIDCGSTMVRIGTDIFGERFRK